MTVRRFASGFVALAIVCGAAWVLFRATHTIAMADLFAAVRGTSAASLIGSGLATVLSFSVLGYYDRIATEMVVPRRVSIGRALYVGMVSHAISNTLGLRVLTSSALRYRLYRQTGLGMVDIVRVTAIVGVCVVLGSVTMLVIALAFAPDAFAWGRIVVAFCLTALLAMLACFPAIARQLQLRNIVLPFPDRSMLVKPMCIGLVEAGAAILAFYVLLPFDLAPDFATLAAIILAATLLGALSLAPGGIGVFEAAVLTAFPAQRYADVLAALLLYRLLYNLVPFCAAVVVLAIQQARVGAATSIRGRV